MLNMKNQINEKIYQCHSGLDPESHEILNQVQDDNIMEHGRSMVEMLGVLAIMGLLTIIGIAGFKMAMNKAKANSLVADMNRLAHIVVMDKFSGYSEEAIENAVTEHNQSTEYQAIYKTLKPGIFTLEATGIDKDLCQQVAGLGWKVPLATFVDGVEKDNFVAEDCGDSNTLTWAFTDDLSACPDCVLAQVDCPPPEEMECGTCTELKGFAVDHSQCANNANGNKCARGKCEKCEEGQFWRNNANECFRCSDIGEGYYCASSNQADKCYGKGFYIGSHWQCGTAMMSCFAANESIGSADADGCKACPNRCYANGTCNLFGSDKRNLSKNDDGTCTCNEVIGAFEVNGICRWCDENTFLNRYSPSHCEACGTSYQAYSIHAHKCLGSGFYWHDKNDNTNGNMTACSVEVVGGNINRADGYWNRSYWADEESCKACKNSAGIKNRCWNAVKSSCPLTGDSKPYLRNADGSCSCNTAIGAFVYDNDCRRCPDNQFINAYGGSCKACAGADNFAVDEEKHKCSGIAYYQAYKDGKKHYGGDGVMKDCSNTGAFNTNTFIADEESCKACSQRCYNADDQSCHLANGSPYYRVSSSDEALDGTCTTTPPSQ